MSKFSESDRKRIFGELINGQEISMNASAADWYFLVLHMLQIMNMKDLPEPLRESLIAFTSNVLEALAVVSPDAVAYLQEQDDDK